MGCGASATAADPVDPDSGGNSAAAGIVDPRFEELRSSIGVIVKLQSLFRRKRARHRIEREKTAQDLLHKGVLRWNAAMTLQRYTRTMLHNRRLKNFGAAFENNTAFLSALGAEHAEDHQELIKQDRIEKEKFKLFLRSEQHRRNKIAQGMKNEEGRWCCSLDVSELV